MQRNKRNHLKLDNKKFVRMCHESCLHRARPSGEVPKSLVARSAHCSFSSGAPGLEEMKHELNGSSTVRVRKSLSNPHWSAAAKLGLLEKAAAGCHDGAVAAQFWFRKQIPTAAMPALPFNVCPTPANLALRKKYPQKSSTPGGGLCRGGLPFSDRKSSI